MNNSITITITAVAPLLGSETETVGLNQRVREVKVSVMGKMGYNPSQEGVYGLIFQVTRLPEDQTIGEAGITDGATLGLIYSPYLIPVPQPKL